MPEGPDVWYLCRLINRLNYNLSVYSHGKHIYVKKNDKYIDYSFGLTGKLIVYNGEISKNNCGFLPGDTNIVSSIGEGLGVSFMDMELEDFQKIVDEKFKNSKAVLATTILNQKIIAGIGIAWGSEILHIAGLKPDVKANIQDLSNLPDAMYQVKKTCKELFTQICDNIPEDELINTINTFNYRILPMKVYKKGTHCIVSKRTWYI